MSLALEKALKVPATLSILTEVMKQAAYKILDKKKPGI